MKKILVFGNSGAGKSTFADTLARKLNFPIVHLDEIALDEHWNKLPEDEVILILEHTLKQDSWVIDGHYRRLSYEERLKSADTVIVLDLPLHLSLFRCIKRAHASRRGVRRIGAHAAQIDTISLGFLYWILWKYPRHVRPDMLKKLQAEYSPKVIILRSQKEVDVFLEHVK